MQGNCLREVLGRSSFQSVIEMVIKCACLLTLVLRDVLDRPRIAGSVCSKFLPRTAAEC